MYDKIKSGDLIAVSGTGPVSNIIQLAQGTLPNIGFLRGFSGISHVGVAARVYSSRSPDPVLLVYESTIFNRPRCFSSGRDNPRGVQSHTLSDFLSFGGTVWHYPLRCPLYEDEEIRLIDYCESLVGRDYDLASAVLSAGSLTAFFLRYFIGRENARQLFCSELVAKVWSYVGVFKNRNAEVWSPVRLVRHAVRSGVCDSGRILA